MYVHQLQKTNHASHWQFLLGRPLSMTLSDICKFLQRTGCGLLAVNTTRGGFKPRPLTEMFQASTQTHIYIYLCISLININI